MINAGIPNFRVPSHTACGGQCKCGGSCARSKKAGDGADSAVPVKLSGPSTAGKTATIEKMAELTGQPVRRVNLSSDTPMAELTGNPAPSACGGDCSSCAIKHLFKPPAGMAEIRPPVKWAQD